MKNLAFIVCLLATTLPLLPGPGDVPLEVRIDIKPRSSGGVIPVRSMPFHASATIAEAGTSRVIAVEDLDLQPGETKARTETVQHFKVRFQAKIDATGMRAAAAATVWKDERIVTRSTSDVSFGR